MTEKDIAGSCHILRKYLKKISRCEGGDVVARGIADSWKQNYKRRSAMMDELKKAGF